MNNTLKAIILATTLNSGIVSAQTIQTSNIDAITTSVPRDVLRSISSGGISSMNIGPNISTDSESYVKGSGIADTAAYYNGETKSLSEIITIVNSQDPLGVKVTEILDAKYASKLDLQVGDIITGVELLNRSIENTQDFLDFYQSVDAGIPIELRIIRKGEIGTITIIHL